MTRREKHYMNMIHLAKALFMKIVKDTDPLCTIYPHIGYSEKTPKVLYVYTDFMEKELWTLDSWILSLHEIEERLKVLRAWHRVSWDEHRDVYVVEISFGSGGPEGKATYRDKRSAFLLSLEECGSELERRSLMS